MKRFAPVSLCVAALALAASPINAQQNQGQGPGAPVQTTPPATPGQGQQGPGDTSGNSDTGPTVPVPSENTAERFQFRSEFSRELGLSANQDAQVEQIRARQRAEISAINQNAALTQAQRRAQINATVRSHNAQIQALMNGDQLRLLDQARDRERERLRTVLGENLAERLQTRSRLAQELGVSTEQLAQIERLRTQQRNEIEAMNQNSEMTEEQRRLQLAATVQNYGNQVRAMLNPDQIQKLDQVRERERQRAQTMQMDNIAELLQRRSQLTRELGLSAEQEAQLVRIREQQRAEIASLNQNRELTQQQRREQIEATLQRYGEQLRAMLREDQLQQLDQIRDFDRLRDRDRDRTYDRKRLDRT